MLSYLEGAKIIRAAMDKAGMLLTDNQALEVPELYPFWSANVEYKLNDRVRYLDILYKCIIPHISQSNWNPVDAPSLWAKVLTSESGEPLPWEQPDSTNPYMKGDKVTHNGFTWKSLIDNNVWEPGVVGTENLWSKIDE